MEVLRGPQGTLYGSGSVGGTVRIIPAAPDLDHLLFRATGEVSATKHAGDPSGSFNATLNLPITPLIALRLNGGYDYQSGWIDAAGLLKHAGTALNPGALVLADPADPVNSGTVSAPTQKGANYSDIKFARAALLVKPSDLLQINLTGLYQDNYANNRNEDNPYYEGKEYQNYSAFLQPQTSRILLGDLDLAVDLGFANLTSATTYSAVKTHSTSDNSGFLQTHLASYYFGFPRLFSPETRDNTTKTLTEELRLVSSLHKTIDYVAGAFYERKALKFTYLNNLPGINDYTNAVLSTAKPVNFGDTLAYGLTSQSFQEYAVYGEATVHVTPKLDVTGGARLFRQVQHGISGIPLPYASLTTEYFEQGAVDNIYLLGGFVTYRYASTNSIFKGNVAYKFSDKLLTYATFSQGFRAGGSNSLPLSDPLGDDNTPYLSYQPDKVNNYEIGIKGGRRRFDYVLTAFYIDWTNFQTNLYTPYGVNYIANVPKTKSEGIETQFSFRPAKGLTGNFGYTYVSARTASSFELQAGDPTTTVVSGTALPSSSKHTLSASADYAFDMRDFSARFHTDISYRSGFNGALGNFPQLATNDFYRFSPITVVNASFSLIHGPVEGTIFVNNANNNRGQTTATIASFWGAKDQSYGIIRPRTVGIRLSWNGI